MAFDDIESSGGSISQINVTPLVDVMLVLLVIFMVTAPILQQGVDLELPKETIAPFEGEPEEQLVVSIDKQGIVYVGKGNIIELNKLGDKLSAILASRKDKRVFIRADRQVDYGAVMAAMGRIRRAGINKVGLITEPSDSK